MVVVIVSSKVNCVSRPSVISIKKKRNAQKGEPGRLRTAIG